MEVPNYAYVADGADGAGLQIIDISNPATPTLKGNYDTSGSAVGVQVAGNYGYLAARSSGLQIIDISNPATPTLKGHYDTSGNVLDVQIVGNYAYVADDTSGLQIIDISNPATPTLKGNYDTSGNANGVQIVGNYAYVADYLLGLQIIDISNPATPTLKGNYDTSGYAFGVQIVGNYAYVADWDSGLQIIDISNPAAPTFKGNYNTSGSARDVQVVGNYAYVADGGWGLQIIDISNPAAPTFKGNYDTYYALDVQIVGNYAYVADLYSGLQIIDISNPAAPTFKGIYYTPGDAYDVQIVGNYAYVADGTGGLQIIDVSDFTNPSISTVTLAVSPTSVNEDGTANMVYTFTRSGVTTNALTVNYTLGGTATLNTDYTRTGTTNTVTFAAGSSTATVTIDPTTDTIVESNETVILTLATGTGYTVGTPNAATGTITNDDTSVTLAVSPTSVNEDGTTNLVYTFTRSGVTTNALTVNYTVGGTATNGTDYTSIPTSVTFAANASTATVIVDPTADTTVESDETVALTLATGTGYTVGTPNTATGTITNDDTSVTLAVSPTSVTEDGTANLVYTFTRSGDTTNPLTVNYTIGGTATNGTDYTSIPTSVTFDANSSTATVTVDPTADTTVESDETVALTLATGTGYTVGTPNTATGTITNDDTSVTLTVSPTSVTEDGTANLVYTFTRSGDTTNPLTVNYSIGGTATLNTDYTRTGTTNTVTFAAGSSTATVTIDPTTDTTVENNETVILTLATGTGYTVGTPNAATGTIFDLLSQGLKGQYYNGYFDDNLGFFSQNPSLLTRIDTNVNFLNNSTSWNLNTISQLADLETFSAQWNGYINIPVTGNYTFYLNSDDASYLFLDSATLAPTPTNATINNGGLHVEKEVSKTVNLTAGLHDILLVFGERTVQNIMQFSWSSSDANITKQIVPSSALFNDGQLAVGSLAFSSPTFSVNEDGTPVTAVTVNRTGGSFGEVGATISLSDGTATAGNDYINTPITVTFANGETSKTVTISINNDTVYEPTETVNLTLSNPTNGATLGTQTTAVLNLIDNDAVAGVLSFSNATYNINENGTPVTQVTINRTGGSDGAISTQILLTNGTATAGSDYVATPITVNFANGETSKTVTIPIINDTVLENTETINLTLANATGGATIDNAQKNAIVNILDDDFKPTLTVNINTQQVTEGNTIQGTITRNTDTTEPLTVTLVNSDNSQITVPNTVTIPAGANSVNFNITAVDDTLIELPKNYNIIASASGFVSSSNTVAVIDNDGVILTLTLASNSISENGGKVIATITRNIVTNTPLEVQLSSSDTTEATVPSSVIIAANQASATFEIQGVDDTILDGTQAVLITAKPTYTGTSLTVDAGQATANLNVTDNESPSLTLTVDKNIISETGTATATITRNTDTTEALTVNLASSDTTEATVPQTVTIPVGQSSATFIVTGVNDGVNDGIQSVTLTAAANGFNSGVKTIEVSDIDVPDLQITNFAATTNPLYTGKQSFLTYKVENKGLSPALGTWTDKVYLSTDNKLDSSDSLITETTFTPDIPFNSFYERNIPFFAPRNAGQYYLIATTDANNTVNEGTGLGEQNNTIITPITVIPAYKATVYTDTVIGTNSQAVTLRGSAVNNADNSPVPFEFVSIKIENNGTIRDLSAFTDGNGNFVKSFNPLPTEGGQYNINAYFPNNPNEDSAPEDSFQLLGMKFNTNQVTNKVIADTPFTGSVTLENITNIGITGITATVDSVVEGWTVQVNSPSTLAGSGNNTISYTINAPNDSYITQDTFKIKLTSAEGATAVLPVNVNLERIVPRLVASTNLVSSGMLRGNQTVVEFQVTNEGGGIAQNIEVELPNEPWLKLASPATISALNPGQSTTVTLLLTPDSNLPLTEYFGNFYLDAEGNDGDLSVNYNFRAISDAKGNISINTVDELFYFAEGAPKLANATVTLRDYFTNQVIATAVTDNTGLINLSNINEGYYNLEIKADRHDTFRQIIQLDAGETENINAFLSRNTVQYNWTVTPTEIEDKYNITVESVFETDVPIPTVVIDPPLIDLAGLDVVGQVMQVDMTLTNHGLIAANHLNFSFSDHPFYKIEPLINNIGSLGAKSSITVPIRITRIADFNTLQSSSELATLSSPSVPCGIVSCVKYDYICGIPIYKCTSIAVNNVEGNCPSSPWNPQRSGGGGGGGGFTPVPVIVNLSNCDPCVDKTLTAIAECAISFIPLPVPEPIPCIESGLDCFEQLNKKNLNDINSNAILPCIQTGLECFKDIPVLGSLITILDCTCKIINACEGEKATLFDCLKQIGNILPLSSQAFFSTQELQNTSISTIAGIQPLREQLTRLQKVIGSQMFLFGDSVWFENFDEKISNWVGSFSTKIKIGSSDNLKISTAERNELLSIPFPGNVTVTDVDKFLDRWNRSVDYWDAGILNYSDVPVGQNTDFIALDIWQAWLESANDAINESLAKGFSDISQEIKYSIEQLKQSLEGGTNGGVCAQVRITIDQEAVMTRSAFLGTLEIDNGNPTNLTNLAVTLQITDQNGNIVNDLFGITNPVLKNITAVDGTGILIGDDPNTSQNEGLGSAEWTFIPTNLAAPQTATNYNIGGTLSYTENGQVINVPLLSTGITVLPQAELYLDYFQSRNVYGDDPFTDTTEISVPFDLAVLVQNKGYGDAKNLRITSSQPKIVDNEKGLLIDFTIIGSQLNGEDATPSLKVNFGDIKAGQTAVANWLLKSTLQGKFIEYKATFEHINGLGNKELSLIKEVKIHELISKVKADSDNLPDFLVNDQFDANFYPDTLYFSNGTTAPVTAIDTATVDAPVTIFDLEAQITATAAQGWTYITLEDPANGQFQIKQLLRSDGTLINLDNIWRTDRTFPATGRPIYENILHFLDKDSTGSYTIIYNSNDNAAPQVREIIDVSPNPRNIPVNSLSIVFTEPIRANTFDYQDLTLTLDGGANLITNGVTISQIDPITFQINNLTGITGNIGQYQLSVNATGIQDLAGNNGAGIVSENWTFTGDRPGIASIIGFNSTLLNTPVNTFDVTFTEAIIPSSFDYTDITLRRNNGESLVNNTVTITQINPTTFRVSNFAQFTNIEGDYQLLVTANGVQDTDNNNGVGGKGFNWVLDNTIPTLTSITNVTSPRNTAISSLEISFSEAIKPETLDFNDLTLTRDGSVNLITNTVTLEKRNETTYTIKGLSGLQTDNGVYTLTVNGTGIKDPGGNSVSNSLTETWTLDRILPGIPTNIQVTATPLSELQTTSLGILNQAGQFRVNSQNITITGDLPESNLRVYIKDLTTNQNLGQATVTGTQFNGNIQLYSPGSRNLEIQVQDAAGNTSNTTLSLFADISQPVLTQFLNVPTSSANAINSIDVQFSEQININTFDKSDITLTRDGVTLTLPNTVTVTSLSDTTYRINGLGDLTNTPGIYNLKVDATTIQDNAGNSGDAAKTTNFIITSPSTPGITLTQTGGNTTITEGGNTDTYSLVLKTQPTNDVTITLTGDSQITLNSTTFTFTPTNWNTPQTVTITAVDDTLTEGNQTATITHNISSSDTNYNGLTIGTVNVSIQDNDAEIKGTVWNDIDGNAVNNSEPSLSGWTVYLDTNNNNQLDTGETSTQTNANGDYTFNNLRPGNYNVAQVVQTGWKQTHPILNITTTAADIPLTIPTLDLIPSSTNTQTQLNFNTANYIVKEDGTAITEIIINRSGNLTETVTATLTFTDGTAKGCGCAASSINNDFNYSPITITFTENEISKVIPVQNAILNNANAIRIRNDNKVEGDEYFTIHLTNPTNGAIIGNQGNATVTIIDDESPNNNPITPPISNPSNTLSTSQNSNATNLINLDDFWSDSRFTNIKGQGESIVIIDTGADLNHPLFGVDANNNGIADKIIYQYDFADNDADASDKNNHGSHITSIASQIAPDANLIILKVFKDDGSGYFADLEEALQWVNTNANIYNVTSVNLSLGDNQNWTTATGRYGIGDELAAIAGQNILIAAAAGNSFYTFNSSPGLAYPAADPNVISVGAVWADDFGSGSFSNGAKDYTTAADRIASFSQRHPILDVFAPGILISGANATGGTITMGGTSQAVPYISAIATLGQQIAQTYLGRELTLTEFRTLLDTTSNLIIDGDDENDNVTNTGISYPRINALALAENILNLNDSNSNPDLVNPGNNNNNGSNTVTNTVSLVHNVTLTAGQILTGINFGNQQLPSNQPPTLNNINKSGDEDNPINFSQSDFTSAFNDADGNTLVKIQITALPNNGVLQLNNTAIAINEEIAVSDLNNLTFSPNTNFNGNITFSWNGFDGSVYANNAATVNITINPVNDDVTPTNITLAVSPSSVNEDGTTNLVYTFTRTGATTDALTLNYTVGGTATFNTDYTQTGAASFTSTTGTVSFAANSATATVTVDPTTDTNVEPDETVALTLASGTGYAIGTTEAVVGIITDNDNDNETPSNQAPTDLALSATTVNENVAPNTVIGTFSSTDPDTGNSFTYSLVAGTGDTDNTAFSIVGNQLQINNSPDFETKNSYSIRVKTTDQGGLGFEKVLVITVNDVNETPGNLAPTDLALSATTVNENVAPNTVIGTFSSTDPDTGNSFTYSLVVGTGDTDNTAFSIVGNQLQINNSPDFETKNSYSIRVKTTDQGGLGFEKVLVITVNDLNETPGNLAPTDLALSATTVNENVAPNTVIGTFSSTDPDTGNSFTYSLIAGTGDTDNTAFSIVGNQLQINNSPDFETKNSYSIRVKTTDQGGLGFEKVLTITVNDLNETPGNLAPTALIFQNAVTELAENVDVTPEFKVADLLIEDDGLGTNNLSLTGRDRERFLIQNSALFYVGFAPNFEAQNSYEVTVNVDDPTVGVTPDLTQTLTLNITDVNEAPTALILANSTKAIAENSDTSQGVKVADIQISDDALGTNSLSLLGNDQSSFQIRGRELFFIGKADFEAQALYNLTVAVTDTTLKPAPNATPDATVNFTLEITNLPDQAVNPQTIQFNNTGDGQGSLVFNFSDLPGSIQVKAIEEGLQQTGAFFNNVVGLYPVADDNGAVFDSLDLDGDGNATELIQPSQAGYARTALSQAVNNFILRASGEGANQSTTAAEFGDVLLEGGRRYAPFVIANGGNLGESLQGSIQAFLTKNPDNVAATLENYMTHEVAYFSFGAANPDGAEHLRSRGNNIFGFEDLPGNLPNISDNDFNDGILAFNFIA